MFEEKFKISIYNSFKSMNTGKVIPISLPDQANVLSKPKFEWQHKTRGISINGIFRTGNSVKCRYQSYKYKPQKIIYHPQWRKSDGYQN